MWNSKSSIILGLALTVPLMVASLSVGLPIWVHNGYRFYRPSILEHPTTGVSEQHIRRTGRKEVRKHGSN
jgi:hypothetical protein